MSHRLVFALLVLVLWPAAPSGQSDLDAFMARVLARRDDNWRKLQQYVLEETETFQLLGPAGAPLYGFRREYLWFPRDGRFIKSPLVANGVTVGEGERRRYEDEWVRREERRAERDARRRADSPSDDEAAPIAASEAAVRDALEPGFVSAAYFLRFTFDPGQYALAGREQLEGRDVLRIEYYPTRLFREGRTRPNRRLRERDESVQTKMNKTALVTLWIDPDAHQILRYRFENVDMDFLPGRSIVRIDGLDASMEMGQPFEGVWLPRSIRIGFDLTLAVGQVDGRYAAEYHDYRLAAVTTRVR